ncbi:hypothetical protein [Nocardioides sp. Root151]|uniref:hypothetical protein n=1 Tax=Nocardioides sp. Root151 TaxID=1736475 RepID=UPI0007038690|nr:hypothetical protein [Nocardioides sp. Root151]KQZ70199.1 hypothetical protein ASD66_11145 [Nocardioides sp. Root151]
MSGSFRLSATLTIATAVIAGAGVLRLGGAPGHVVGTLRGLGADGYAWWYVAVLLTPLVLLAAAVGVRRTPWPWITAVVLHLASVVAATVRVEHWLSAWAWSALVGAVAVGLWSVAVALAGPRGTTDA